MKIRKRLNGNSFSLEIEKGGIALTINIENDKRRLLWINYANAKHDKIVWGRKRGKYTFCFQIPRVITLDTAYLGKKIVGRINLTRLFGKDYMHYGGSGITSSPNY